MVEIILQTSQKTVRVLGILPCTLLSGFYAWVCTRLGEACTKICLGSFPVSSITITHWSEVTWNPLVWNKEGKMLWVNSVETVCVGRVETTLSSEKQQLLSLPLFLEQSGIIFLGCLCWRGYWLCTRDSGSGFSVTLCSELLTQGQWVAHTASCGVAVVCAQCL